MIEGPVTAELLDTAGAALATGYTQGTLAILDEEAFARFARDLCATVARQAVLALDSDDLAAAIAEAAWLEPGGMPLTSKAGGGFDTVATEQGVKLSFRGAVQERLAFVLRCALEKQLHAAYNEARA